MDAPGIPIAVTDAGREIVSVGYDGRSKAMLRFRDELHLPDHLRSVVVDKREVIGPGNGPFPGDVV